MKAGRELDALIATKVMGLELCASSDGHLHVPVWGADTVTCAGTKRLFEAPSYSSSIANAWKVVEKLAVLRRTDKEIGGTIYKPVIRLELYEHDDQYEATLGRCKGIVGDDTDIRVSGFVSSGNVPNEPRESYMERAMCWTICQLALRVCT